MKRKRRSPTVCQACGCSSYNGRVCRACRKFYGGPPENAIAAAALARRAQEVGPAILLELADYIVPDLGSTSLPQLLHSNTARQPPRSTRPTEEDPQ